MTNKIEKLYLNAGQMKAGTTYLYDVLRFHKEIFFSPEKEINFLSHMFGHYKFLHDSARLRKAKQISEIAIKLDRPLERYQETMQWVLNYLRPPNSVDWYKDVFIGHRPDQWLADFSNLTCTIQPVGLKEILEIADDVRITYCVREPVSRAISHAKFHLHFGGKDADLSKLSESELRKLLLSENVLPQSNSVEHLENLLNVFGRDRVRIIEAESLWENPNITLTNLCTFLDISKPQPIEAGLAKNVGPKVTLTESHRATFEILFSEQRKKQNEFLEQNSDLLISRE